MRVELSFLGTGTSQGVPVIACSCSICRSTDDRDRRLRSSVLIGTDSSSVVIDAGPDFRQQMLCAEVQHLDAVVLTHEHKDHIGGMDDIRAFNFGSGQDMPVYATAKVQVALEREFHYAFAASKYPGVPRMSLRRIDTTPFEINGVTWWPLPAWHHQLPVLGFRVGGIAYITDANRLEDLTWERLQGVDVLILNALRKEAHLSHFTLDEAIDVAKTVGARQTYFTHISHQMGAHQEISAALPAGMHLAVDGLCIASDGPSWSEPLSPGIS